MPYVSLNHLIVYTCLSLTLFIGLRIGKGNTSIQTYAVTHKMWGTAVLVCTYLATNLAGSFVFSNASLVFSHGILVTCSFLGFCIAELTAGLFMAPHAAYFKNCLTMGDVMQQLYGPYSGILAGLLGLLQATCIAGMELVALGLICKALLGIQATWGIIIGGLVMALYAAYGGIQAIVTMDVLQCFTLLLGIPIIAYLAVHRAGGIQALFTQLPADKLALGSHKNLGYYVVCFLVWGIFPSGLMDPAIIQRMLMGKDPKQLRSQYFITAILHFLFQLVIMFIGLAGFVIYPTVEAQTIVPHLIREIFPIGIQGCIIASLLALIMSTVGSYLHIAGLTLVHDVIKPLGKQYNLKITHEPRWIQGATLLVGSIAISIGASTTDMFELLLDSLALTGPFLLFPLLSGIIGLKPIKKAFYSAILTTLIVWALCKWLLPQAYSYLTTLISILTNGFTFLGVHWITYKKWVMVLRPKHPKKNILPNSRRPLP